MTVSAKAAPKAGDLVKSLGAAVLAAYPSCTTENTSYPTLAAHAAALSTFLKTQAVSVPDPRSYARESEYYAALAAASGV